MIFGKARPQKLILRDVHNHNRICFTGEFPSIARAKGYAYSRGYQLGNDDWELHDIPKYTPPPGPTQKSPPPNTLGQWQLQKIAEYYIKHCPWYAYPHNYSKCY